MTGTPSENVSLIDRFSTSFVRIACALFFVAALLPAQAQQLQQLAMFSGADGNGPNSRLVMDAAGNLYGTTFNGGRGGGLGPGTVFKLSHGGSGWILTTLYEFRGGTDGYNPWGGVVFGPDGTLYGTTYGGGTHDFGLVFRLQPPPTVCSTVVCYWHKTVLYNFTGGADGGDPQGDLTFDAAGNMYGTAFAGGQGGHGGFGVVYRLAPSQGGWTESALYAFSGGADGGEPQDGVVLDHAGNLYGVAGVGGADSLGAVYKLTNSNGTWTEAVLHSFAGGSDGSSPAGLTIDSAGNLYGEAGAGGANNNGTAFQLQPSGGGFNYNIIANYTAEVGGPVFTVSLTADSSGNLYGCNAPFNQQAYGTAFKLTPAQGSWTFTTLYSFNQEEGYNLNCKPLLDSQGDIFGTAGSAGQAQDGTVWKLTL
jgi:uncharacterized repeat protein (TIGR03803 family)